MDNEKNIMDFNSFKKLYEGNQGLDTIDEIVNCALEEAGDWLSGDPDDFNAVENKLAYVDGCIDDFFENHGHEIDKEYADKNREEIVQQLVGKLSYYMSGGEGYGEDNFPPNHQLGADGLAMRYGLEE